MYIWRKVGAAGQVGSGQTFCRQSHVGSGRVNVSPGRVGSGPRKVTRGQLCDRRTSVQWIPIGGLVLKLHTHVSCVAYLHRL